MRSELGYRYYWLKISLGKWDMYISITPQGLRICIWRGVSMTRICGINWHPTKFVHWSKN
mgnify:CR=1 FL=1